MHATIFMRQSTASFFCRFFIFAANYTLNVFIVVLSFGCVTLYAQLFLQPPIVLHAEYSLCWTISSVSSPNSPTIWQTGNHGKLWHTSRISYDNEPNTLERSRKIRLMGNHIWIQPVISTLYPQLFLQPPIVLQAEYSICWTLSLVSAPTSPTIWQTGNHGKPWHTSRISYDKVKDSSFLYNFRINCNIFINILQKKC
jgi:hypothetical protein